MRIIAKRVGYERGMIGGFSRSVRSASPSSCRGSLLGAGLSSYEKVPLGELRGQGFRRSTLSSYKKVPLGEPPDSREMLRSYKDKEMKVWERSKLYNSRIQEATDLNG